MLTLLTLLGCASGSAEIEANPICDISAIVRWTTRQPASSWVEFGEGEVATHRIGDDALTTEHEVIVVGMKAERSYTLTPVSVTESGKEIALDPIAFDAGPLPEAWLMGEVDVLDEAQIEPGWTLTNPHIASIGPLAAVMLDTDGEPVWYYLHDGDDGRADMHITSPAPGEILFGPGVAAGEHIIQMDLAGREIWRGPEQPGEGDSVTIEDGQLHHSLLRTDDGGLLTVESDARDGIVGDQLLWMDAELETRWTWNLWDHVPFNEEDVNFVGWWTHVNSAVPHDGDVFVNSWVLSNAWRVDPETDAVVWTLGDGGDFAADPDAEYPWFTNAHSFDPLGDGRYIIYDNGNASRPFSRVVEYTLDEAAMTAEISWEYPGELADDFWYNAAEGDVDALENGNVLITGGNTGQGDSISRLQEVTRGGEIVWRMWWADPDAYGVGAYQSERVQALAEPL